MHIYLGRVVLFQIIFNDAKEFHLDGPDGFNGCWNHVWRGRCTFSKQLLRMVFMIWAAYSFLGKVALAFTSSSRMNSEGYQQVLADNLLHTVECRCHRLSVVFHQDNPTIYVNASERAWLGRQKVEILDLPVCSPDKNPMENLWDIVVWHVLCLESTVHISESTKIGVVLGLEKYQR